MSSKGTKTRKKSKKASMTKIKNEQTEVFVLPPDLLEKLGINLERVAQLEKCSAIENTRNDSTSENSNENFSTSNDTVTGNSTHTEKPFHSHTNETEKLMDAPETTFDTHTNKTEKLTEGAKIGDQTILETARLMKDSVFLSPTFAATGSYINPKEIVNTDQMEIIDSSPSDTYACTVNYSSTWDAKMVSQTPPKIWSEIKTEQLVQNFNNIIQADKEAVQLAVTNNITDTPSPLSNDDHPDEAYSSDCSNSNYGPLETLDIALSYIPDKSALVSHEPKEHKKKINIINEEVLSPKQIKKLNSLHPPKFTGFIPISLNTVINEDNIKINPAHDIKRKLLDATHNVEFSSDSPLTSETIVLFDEKGDVINTDTEEMTIGNAGSIHDIVILEQADQELLNKTIKSEGQGSENSFGVCIDLAVTDIEMNLTQSEEILKTFADEITSNDNNEILMKIEDSEKDCFEKSIVCDNAVILVPKNSNISDTISEAMIVDIISNMSGRQSSNTEITEDNNISKNYTHIDPLPLTVTETENINNPENYVVRRSPYKNNSNSIQDDIIYRKNHEGTVDQTKKDQTYNFSKTFETNHGHKGFKTVHMPKEDTIYVKTESNNNTESKSVRNGIWEVAAENANVENQTNKVENDSCKNENDGNCKRNKNVNSEQNTKNENVVFNGSINYEINPNIIGVELENKHKSDGLKYQLESHLFLNGDGSSADMDKVKEIAIYLHEFAKKHINRPKTENVNNIITPAKRSEHFQKSSKLHKQGVEKPGGSKTHATKNNKAITPLKTYGSVKNKPNSLLAHSLNLERPVKTQATESDSGIEFTATQRSIILDDHVQTHEFCNCGDFGRLAYYDSNHVYEHIHFWEHKTIDCNFDILFSIYSDDRVDIDPRADIHIEETVDTNEKNTKHSICWNTLENYYPDENVPSNQESGDDLIATESSPKIDINAPHSSNAKESKPGTLCVKQIDFLDKYVEEGISNKKNTNTDICQEKNMQRTDVTDVITKEIDKNDDKCNSPKAENEEISDSGKDTNKKCNVRNKRGKGGNNDECSGDTQDDSVINIVEGVGTENAEKRVSSQIIKQQQPTESIIEGNKMVTNNEVAECISPNVANVIDVNMIENDQQLIANDLDASISKKKIKKNSNVGNTLSERVQQKNENNMFSDTLEKIDAAKDVANNSLTNENVYTPPSDQKLIEGIEASVSGMKAKKRSRVSNRGKLIQQENENNATNSTGDTIDAAKDITNPIRTESMERGAPCKILGSEKELSIEGNTKGKERKVTVSDVCSPKAKASASEKKAKKDSNIVSNRGKRVKLENEKNCVQDLTDEAKAITEAKSVQNADPHDTLNKLDPSKEGITEGKLAKKNSNPKSTKNKTVALVNSEFSIQDVSEDLKKTESIEKSVPNDLQPDQQNRESTELKKGKKRRKLSVVTDGENVDEFMEPSSKKSVKCGVCKRLLAESEWDSHVSQEHCCIAWIEGHPVDFTDPDLRKKLQGKLKSEGSLECPRCGNEHKTARKFLSHVEQCLKNSADNTMASSTSVLESSLDISVQSVVDASTTISDGFVKCGVCKEDVSNTSWMEHIASRHNYLAWKDGEKPLDLENEDDLRKHLVRISRKVGNMRCYKCGISRKYPKMFLSHIQLCKDVTEISVTPRPNRIRDSIQETLSTSDDPRPKRVRDLFQEIMSDEEPLSSISQKKCMKCGVCKKMVTVSMWYEHMGKEHEYLTWVDGEDELDVNNKEAVKAHLHAISKAYGGLTCVKCGFIRKYVKTYLQHVQGCTGPVEIEVPDKSFNETLDGSITIKSEAVSKCGVCHKNVPRDEWMQHIKTHDYMAWKAGETLDVNNKNEVQKHLTAILDEAGSLECSSCGVPHDSADKYMKHIAKCYSEKTVVCAVCSKQIAKKNWYDHKMTVHYNVAWAVGEDPIDVKQSKIIEKYVKDYRNVHSKLVCRICGITRASCVGFYAHVVVCGKSEEEADFHRRVCSICNKKYLCVYENQHMTYHREQEIRELKLREQQESELERQQAGPEPEVEVVPGRRRAAQKARTVIENYKKELSHELAAKKATTNDEEESDSGESAAISSEEESEDSEVDSNISAEEEMSGEEEEVGEEEDRHKKRRRQEYTNLSSRIQRFPFTPNDPNSYILKSCNEFYEYHHQTESLYPELREYEWEVVREDRLSQYLPPLEQSCKFKLHGENWMSFRRFEAARVKCTKTESTVPVIFMGMCIQTIKWVPTVIGEEDSNGHFLAISGHLGSDLPRLDAHDVTPHPGIIQIWDYGNFNTPPKFVLGLVHDNGTAWAMDWCPSGARDDVTPEIESQHPRLGLLAVAFSTGSTFIFSIPYPSVIVNDKDDELFYKLKPVMELRLTASNERKVQATSVCWSTQKNYETIMVGYSNGFSAFFDLKTDSPLLRTKENNITVIYPYHDFRMSYSCITGVGMFPNMGNQVVSVCSSSPTGAMLAARCHGRPTITQSTMASTDAQFMPIWPSAMLTGDDCMISSSINEMEWFGCGRRLGVGTAAASCGQCARLALAAAPLLMVSRRHPVVDKTAKDLAGEFQMSPLGKKTAKSAKDQDPTEKTEPSTYEEAVKIYGVEAKLDKSSLEKLSFVREPVLNRFPLADITSMCFCPSRVHHRRLAVALHSGFVIITQV